MFYWQLRVIEIRQSQVLNIFDNQASLSRISSASEIIVWVMTSVVSFQELV